MTVPSLPSLIGYFNFLVREIPAAFSTNRSG